MLSPFQFECFLFVVFVAMFIYSLSELEISMIFYVIDMIFNEKLLIGESMDFSWYFCIYIGRKWFELWVEIGVLDG